MPRTICLVRVFLMYKRYSSGNFGTVLFTKHTRYHLGCVMYNVPSGAWAESKDPDQAVHPPCQIFWCLSVRSSVSKKFITKTRLYSFDPLKPHFYIVKLGFTLVYIIFLISTQKHRLWVLVRTASSRRFLRVPQSMFWAEIWKISEIFIWKFPFFGWKIFSIFE